MPVSKLCHVLQIGRYCKLFCPTLIEQTSISCQCLEMRILFYYCIKSFNCLKKIAIILLVPLLLFNTIGYYLVFYGDLIAAKHEAAVYMWGHDMKSERIVTISFPLRDGDPVASDMVFTDDDEFVYQGRMYDVISSTQSKGMIQYKCYTDNRETMMTQNLTKKFESDSDTPTQKQQHNSPLKEFTKDYTHQKGESLRLMAMEIQSYHYLHRAVPQPSIYKAIVSPPPEVFAN